MANGNDAISRRFSLLEKELEQKQRGQTQQQKEGLRRRFAAQGGLGSGAAIKAEQIAEKEGQKRIGEARGQLGIAEAGERQRQQELREQRAFQTSERLGGQQFAGGQARLGREFQRGERLGGQEFAGGQARLGREFQRGERLGSQQFAGQQSALQRALQERGLTEQERAGRAAEDFRERQLTQQREQFDISEENRNIIAQKQQDLAQANLDFQQYSFEKEFPINEQIAMANMEIQRQQAEQAGAGILGSIFGGNPFASNPFGDFGGGGIGGGGNLGLPGIENLGARDIVAPVLGRMF
jgi:hypothetical protein